MDPTAEFGRLFDSHRDAVHAYFVGRTGDRWAAADLTQEVFLRVWQRLREVSGRSVDGQRAWIFTVARNLSVDAWRRERCRADTETAMRSEPGPGSSPPASAGVVAAERVAVVAEAIKRLPEQQRTTLAMAAVADLTSAEIAAVLDTPAGTVRYRLSLARRALAAALADYDAPSNVEQQ
jgi:RNA polymerase sigma-70 factor (ECF subfamily)